MARVCAGILKRRRRLAVCEHVREAEIRASRIEIAASIRDRMARKRIAKVMLADMTGVSLRRLEWLLSAERHLSVEQFVGICHASGMSAPAVLALAEASVRDGHDEK